MKKLLLSLACVLGFTAANATTITLSMEDATDIDGTYVEESYKTDGTLNAAAHYQPVNSLTISGYTFTTTLTNEKATAPAYYWGTEKQPEITLRLYPNTTLTITAPAGVTMRSIKFTGKNGTKDAAQTVNTGALSNITTTTMDWAGEANSITISFAKQFRIVSLEVSDEAGGETPVEPDPDRTVVTTLAQAKALEAGTKYQLDCSPVVAYAYGAYTYVYDGTSYALLYKSGLGLEAGDKLKSGSTGEIKVYQNLVELVPDAVEADGKGTVPAPEVITFDDLSSTLTPANQDAWITINNVVFANNGDLTGNVTVDGESVPVTLYNRFGGDPTKEGTFNVTGFIAVYGETVQIYYTALERVGEEPEPEPLAGEGEGTLESPYNVERALSLVANGQYTAEQVYIEGYITAIDEVSAQYGNATYYLGDTADATATLKVYRGKYFDGAKFTAETVDAIKAGDKLVICGVLTAYNGEAQVNANSSIVTINGVGAVSAVAAEQAPAEYFNLQGMRVANPSNGIFIRRQGGKAVKVLVK